MSNSPDLSSLPEGGLAVVIGASGAIGQALTEALGRSGAFHSVITFSRADGDPCLDLLEESSIEACARHVAQQAIPLRLVFDATGFLHGDGFMPEKGIARIDVEAMSKAFAVNAIGPALLMKHFLPLLPRDDKSVFATLSAKVGSIGDNQLGGWHSYRASKAALNQLVKTASIELRQRKPQAVCVALHPGTVDSPLSAPFSKSGLNVRAPERAAMELLAVIQQLGAAQSGGFFDYRGESLPW